MGNRLEVRLENLSKAYRYRPVFSGLWASIQAGETLVITGPNGSGKSTLLRIICGLTPPTRGQVRLVVEGRPVERSERRRYLGLVAPDLALYDELTALENLEFFARLRGLRLDLAGLRQRLAGVGLAGRGRDLVGTFSSGMKQRLKLAQALLHQPPVLLLDEPGSNLDEAGRALLSQMIAAQRQRGMVLLATNDPQELAYGDRLLHLGE
jgi:heme exporter protein A